MQRIKFWGLFALVLLGAATFFNSCASVKPYQKAYLNDEHMALKSGLLEGYDNNVLNYREGSAGANGGKVGGGCGCN